MLLEILLKFLPLTSTLGGGGIFSLNINDLTLETFEILRTVLEHSTGVFVLYVEVLIDRFTLVSEIMLMHFHIFFLLHYVLQRLLKLLNKIFLLGKYEKASFCPHDVCIRI